MKRDQDQLVIQLMITCVTGLSLQTNNTFSGGFMSASGMSPTWHR